MSLNVSDVLEPYKCFGTNDLEFITGFHSIATDVLVIIGKNQNNSNVFDLILGFLHSIVDSKFAISKI
jgi:hypothetical protein